MDRQGICTDARILDLGTGIGSNVSLLKAKGFLNVTGIDDTREALEFCKTSGLTDLVHADACALPYADGSVDFVLATDILEHVEDDSRALSEIGRVFVPRGRLLITVPTFQSLWGMQDIVAGHKRRYRRSPLIRMISEAGLVPIDRFYFNYILFFPIWLVRRLAALVGAEPRNENEINTRLIYRLLTSLFILDVATAPFLRPPFGVSILVIAEKKTK